MTIFRRAQSTEHRTQIYYECSLYDIVIIGSECVYDIRMVRASEVTIDARDRKHDAFDFCDLAVLGYRFFRILSAGSGEPNRF